jgi:hypothetical protein
MKLSSNSSKKSQWVVTNDQKGKFRVFPENQKPNTGQEDICLFSHTQFLEGVYRQIRGENEMMQKEKEKK